MLKKIKPLLLIIFVISGVICHKLTAFDNSMPTPGSTISSKSELLNNLRFSFVTNLAGLKPTYNATLYKTGKGPGKTYSLSGISQIEILSYERLDEERHPGHAKILSILKQMARLVDQKAVLRERFYAEGSPELLGEIITPFEFSKKIAGAVSSGTPYELPEDPIRVQLRGTKCPETGHTLSTVVSKRAFLSPLRIPEAGSAGAGAGASEELK